jgi:hypothetical protein
MILATKLRDTLQLLLPSLRVGDPVTMIVGMHRSGTSFLTGSLQQAGLELGKHSAWNPHNIRGNRENQDIVALHDAILQRAGFSWDRPPTGVIRWTAEERSQARSIIDCYRQFPRWGFKDPRALMLVEGWQDLLPSVAFVGVFRHPVAVARSLHMRGGMPQAEAFDLWQAYNARLLRLHQRAPFPILNFDDAPEVLLGKLDRLAASLRLRPAQGERFYSDDLRHHRAEEAALPDQLAATLEALRRIAV